MDRFTTLILFIEFDVIAGSQAYYVPIQLCEDLGISSSKFIVPNTSLAWPTDDLNYFSEEVI